MCEDCIQTAANIDPKLMEMVESIKDEMAALHTKIAPQMREIMEMVAFNAETGETPEEANMPAEDIAEIEAMQNKIAGMMGLSYAAAWFNIRQVTDPMQCQMMGESIMHFTHKVKPSCSVFLSPTSCWPRKSNLPENHRKFARDSCMRSIFL